MCVCVHVYIYMYMCITCNTITIIRLVLTQKRVLEGGGVSVSYVSMYVCGYLSICVYDI